VRRPFRAASGAVVAMRRRVILVPRVPPDRRVRKAMLPRTRGEALTQWREFIVAGAEREVYWWVDEPTVAVHPRMLDLPLS
jgi:hypothetical protein